MRIEQRTRAEQGWTHPTWMGTGAAAIVPFLIAFVSAVALADDPSPSPPPTTAPLTLTNQDVGLTAAEIQADQQPAASAKTIDSVSEACRSTVFGNCRFARFSATANPIRIWNCKFARFLQL